MKKIITNFCFLLFALSLNATIRTVSNSPATLAQYSSIQAAVDASTAGDTVYVHASNIHYASVTLDKKIILLGAGWKPQTSPADMTNVNGVVLSLNGNADGSEISGFSLTSSISFHKARNNIRITRNVFNNCHVYFYFSGFSTFDLTSNNILIEGNWFINGGIYLDPAGCNCCGYCTGLQNSLIINNLWYNSYIYNGKYITNVTLNHNLIYGTVDFFQFDSKNFELVNNILINVNPTSINTSWINNLTYNCTGTNTPWIGGTNSGTGNIENQDPQMVDQSSVNSNIPNPLLNFTIPAGPANDSGTDGKDLGLLFDPTGYLNWANSRNPKLPVVNNLLINSTVNPGGNLEIHLSASQAK